MGRQLSATAARAWRRWLLLALWLLLGPAQAATALGDYQHRAWRLSDGAPSQITSLVQDRQGYLWIGAGAGLFRFDGLHFEPFQPPAGEHLAGLQIFALYALPDGDLWLSYENQGVSRIHQGHVSNYAAAEGVPAGTVGQFARDPQGRLWLAATRGLARFDGQRWQPQPLDGAAADTRPRRLLFDRAGTLWLGTRRQLLVRPVGASRFTSIAALEGAVQQLLLAPDGTVWITYDDGTVRRARFKDGQVESLPSVLKLNTAGLRFDRAGNLWVPDLGGGLYFLDAAALARLDQASPAPWQHLTQAQGLSSDYAWPSLLDRQGNLWIGTAGGLDRFRPPIFRAAGLHPGTHDFAMVADPVAGLWVGSTNQPLQYLHEGQSTDSPVPPQITAVSRDPQGTLWLAGNQQVWQRPPGEPPRPFAPSPHPGTQAQAILRDHQGTLWLSISPGLFRWQDGHWRQQILPDCCYPRAMQELPTGQLWLGMADGRIDRLQQGRITRYGAAQGVPSGDVSVLAQIDGKLWAGAAGGLAWFDGNRFQPLQISGTHPLRGVTGIVQADDGSVWLHTVDGVLRLPAAQWRRALAQPGLAMAHQRYDFDDGLPGLPAQLRPLPSAVRSSDGRLWFATGDGVAWIDPRRLPPTPAAPTVIVRYLRSEQQLLPLDDSARLPRGARQIQVGFTALDLASPERIQFRAQLLEVDSHWQPLEGLREVSYNNLAPGHYQLLLQASDRDGHWSGTPTRLAFTLPPGPLQTWWFRLACLLALLLALGLVYLWRVRTLTGRLQIRLRATVEERLRIARELHDTVLQDFQGMLLQIRSLLGRPSGQSGQSGEALQSALDHAEHRLAEGRDRITALRQEPSSHDYLQHELRALGFRLGLHHPSQFALHIEGMPRPLHAAVEQELCAIAGEAIGNAFAHAQARHIEVHLDYRRHGLLLTVSDDGRGIDAQVLAQGGRDGHWGMIGMRERARRIKATLQIDTLHPGSRISLRVPARRAYLHWPACLLRGPARSSD